MCQREQNWNNKEKLMNKQKNERKDKLTNVRERNLVINNNKYLVTII